MSYHQCAKKAREYQHFGSSVTQPAAALSSTSSHRLPYLKDPSDFLPLQSGNISPSEAQVFRSKNNIIVILSVLRREKKGHNNILYWNLPFGTTLPPYKPFRGYS